MRTIGVLRAKSFATLDIGPSTSHAIMRCISLFPQDLEEMGNSHDNRTIDDCSLSLDGSIRQLRSSYLALGETNAIIVLG